MVVPARSAVPVSRMFVFRGYFWTARAAIVPRVMAAHEKVKQQNYRFT